MVKSVLIFSKAYGVELFTESLTKPSDEELLVKTLVSAISPGTEMLIYRGLVPPEMALDTTIPSLKGTFGYPLRYGYSCVGEVIAVGSRVDAKWLGRQVFCFHPHETHFTARLDELIGLPCGMDLEDAPFLPSMETAVNFLMDGRPMIGERVAVFGQGVVGLLTTALLTGFPLAALATLDRYGLRREASLGLGAGLSLDPESEGVSVALGEFFGRMGGDGTPDLIFELSGNPQALSQALGAAGLQTRLVVGSWYGSKAATLDLGGAFHRNRVRLVSSQVSSLDSRFWGRWSKARRMQVVLKMLAQVQPSRFITHRLPFQNAAQAYDLLDKQPQEALQVILMYP
jgi:2-desacetyl-2-hydroxyethyl bacteriochlorophyllide A dehydrogenase